MLRNLFQLLPARSAAAMLITAVVGGVILPPTGNAAPVPQYNLTCLAPILNRIDPDAPADSGQAYLFGPWKRPVLRDDIGKVNFPLSTANGEMQVVFNQGMALLHLFWYAEAERCFRTATVLEPTHPMPWWGLALANERRPQRAALFAAEAERRSHNRGDLSPLERDWLKVIIDYYRGIGGAWEQAAVELTPTEEAGRRRSLVRDLERMAFAYPGDIEVAAALLRRVVVDHHRSGDAIASYYANNLLADRLEDLGPEHPSRHYRLFLWLGQNPRQAVSHAATAPAVSPGVPHAWRYAAETFRAAGRPLEAVELGSRALRSGFREMNRRGEPMPDRIEDFVSRYEAYIDDLTGMGRFAEARQAAHALIGLPRTFYREKRHTHAQTLAGSFFTGRRLLGQLYVRSELWPELLEECESGFLAPRADDPLTRIEALFWQGIAHCNLNGVERAREIVEEMATGLRAAKSEGITAEAEDFMVALARTVRTHAEYSSGQRTGLPDKDIDVTYLPPWHLARMYFAAGLEAEALEIIDAEFTARPNQFLAAAAYCELHHRAGNSRNAYFAFNKLFRSSASLAYSRLPVLGRLNEVAAGMRLGAGWRLPPPKLSGLDPLPAASETGPAVWTPARAPDFSLPDQSGAETSLAGFAGQPLVLNFFLGAGCAFCRQQLDLFTPVLPEFEKAGIPVVGITTDTIELLRSVTAAYQRDNPEDPPLYAFPVLSDSQGLAFRNLGAFEEFEDRPLHGTILLDGAGRVLWRDIGHEPFNHPLQLLREAERLLQIHRPQNSPPGTSNPRQP